MSKTAFSQLDIGVGFDAKYKLGLWLSLISKFVGFSI
jgi:hypothetical protein